MLQLRSLLRLKLMERLILRSPALQRWCVCGYSWWNLVLRLHSFYCIQTLPVVEVSKEVEISDLDDLLRMEREKEKDGDTGLLDADTAGVSWLIFNGYSYCTLRQYTTASYTGWCWRLYSHSIQNWPGVPWRPFPGKPLLATITIRTVSLTHFCYPLHSCIVLQFV